MSAHKVIYIYLGWGALWIIFHILILYTTEFNWQFVVADAIIFNLLLMFSVYIIGSVFRFYNPGLKNIPYMVGWSLVLAVVVMMLFKGLMQFFFANEEYISFVSDTIFVRFAFSFIIISFMIMLHWLWYFIHEQKEAEARNMATEKLAREAELFNLRQQLQPHFLFNSLNSINALIGVKPDQARKMVHELSEFLRGTLKKEENQQTTLEEELNHLKLYLEIEKVRFGHRLQTEFYLDEGSRAMEIPCLLLQPVVENAIKFGLYDTTGPATIKIRTQVEDNMLVIITENPCEKSSSYSGKGTGFGLSSIQRRLYLLYARKDLLATVQKENIFITTIKIPQSK